MARGILGVLVSIALAAAGAAAETARAQPDAGVEIAVEIESLVGPAARASAGEPIVQDMRGFGDGDPAAQAFCQRMGYGRLLGFERADNIGASAPTRTLGDGKLCDSPDCDGFARISCAP